MPAPSQDKIKRKRGRPKKNNPTPKATMVCFYCGQEHSTTQFYSSTSPYSKTHMVPICKDCCRKIANRVSEDGVEHGLTKDSLKTVLRLMDKPYLEKVYDSAVLESTDMTSQHRIGSIFGAYMKTISMVNYNGMTFLDSDMFKNSVPMGEKPAKKVPQQGQDVMDDMQQNIKDVKRLLGYDPFINEAAEDKPLLYSQLVGYLDQAGEANEDTMKISSTVEIVKLFLQAEKINDVITSIMQNPTDLKDNISTIKSLESTKKDIMTTALNLAKDNGISELHNNNHSKGANTLSGKLKELKELNLREQEVNAFDVGTCKGMQQVAEISDAAILKQINLDENDYTEMISEQRKLITKWQKTAEKAQEQARLLLRENLDLKDTLNQQGKKFIKENSVPMDTEGGVNDPAIDEIAEQMKNVSDDILTQDDTVQYEVDEETKKQIESNLKEVDADEKKEGKNNG